MPSPEQVAQAVLVESVEKFLQQWSQLLFAQGTALLEQQVPFPKQDDARKLLREAFGGILTCTIDDKSGAVLLFVDADFVSQIRLTEAQEQWKTWALGSEKTSVGGDKSQPAEQPENSNE
jgi:hypothetical protein